MANVDHYFSVVPNPASELIQLTGYTKNEAENLIEIRDVAGRILYSEKLVLNGAFNYPINVNDYKSGVYYITLSSTSGVATKPVVIAK
ncbi:MAG: T9SS type A sorting domain-containing protein [Bacteroidota bacterium]